MSAAGVLAVRGLRIQVEGAGAGADTGASAATDAGTDARAPVRAGAGASASAGAGASGGAGAHLGTGTGTGARQGVAPLLHALDFDLAAGESLTLVGESGAGKSLLAQAVMGALPAGLVAHGTVTIDGSSSAAQAGTARRHLWGRQVALLPQEPWVALDPTMRVGGQLAESHAWVKRMAGGWPAARQAAAADLQRLGLPDAAALYPWQLSGGMAQRVAFASALAGGAKLLLVDEPTKGLDAALRGQVLAQLQATQRSGGAVLAITHDIGLARALGGRVIVLREGRVVESGPASQVLDQPADTYTRQLLAADPAAWPAAAPSTPGALLLQAKDVVKTYGRRRVVDHANLSVHAGERIGLQGASGAGKTTLGNLLIGVLKPDAGHVERAPGLKPHACQKLYQDPVSAFAPHVSLGTALRDMCKLVGAEWSEVQAQMRALQLPDSLLARPPREVSGGELQRLALLRVLLAKPAVVFADEPTSRLDPLTQQQTIAVLMRAQREQGFALIFVTHHAALARHVAGNRVVVC